MTPHVSSLPETVLVTGAAGFIGSHLTERLLAEGVRVVGVDSFDPYYPRREKEANLAAVRNHPRFAFHETDIRDRNALNAVFEGERIPAVAHLAARAGVRASVEDAETYVTINVNGTLNLLEIMRRRETTHLVFGSSSSVYGDSPAPFREEMPADRPLQPYAASKRAGELLAHAYSHLHGFHVVCPRFFSAYGPRLRPDLAMRRFAELIAEGREIPILGGGSAERDFTYIDDIVDGLLAALRTPVRYEIVNFGNSKTIPMSRVVEALESGLGKPAKRRYLPADPSDMAVTSADISKAKRLFGYEPKVSFEEGIARFLEWFRRKDAP